MDTFLIIGGGALQLPVVREVRELGFAPHVIDRDPNCACKELAHVHPVDVYDREGALRVAREIQARAVAAVAIDAEDTAAYVARGLGLPGPDPEAAETTRDKGRFYDLLSERMPGMLPRHAVVEAPEPPDFPPPWIVRPVDGRGSLGTSFVQEADDFSAAFERARAVSQRGRVLVNEVLPYGAEFSTEVFYTAEGPKYVNSVLRPFLPRAFGAIEIGHLSPAPIAREGHERLYGLAVEVGRHLGVRWGVLKIDTLWPRGYEYPFVLEATLRLSGGCDSTHTYPLAFGRSSVRWYLRACLGEDVPGDAFEDPPERYAAAVGIFGPAGTVERVKLSRPRALRGLGVHEIVVLKRSGKVALEDCRSRLGFVIVRGDDDPWRTWRRGLEAAMAAATFWRYR